MNNIKLRQKIAVVGSREFPQLWMVRGFIDTLNTLDHLVVSGGAQGVDSIAIDQCKFRKIDYIEFKPDYNKYGGDATHKRNDEIIAFADIVVVFWDEISRGSYSMIKKAEAVGKLHEVYKPFDGTRQEWQSIPERYRNPSH